MSLVSIKPRCRLPTALSLLAVLLAGGCKLVTQHSFVAKPGGEFKMLTDNGPPVPPVPALITIRYNVPDPDYSDALKVAVDAARQRKPDVLFRVQTVVPAIGSPDEQVQSAREASSAGRQVADAIAADGVDIGQIELAASAEPGVKLQEVRVFVQ